MTERTFEANRFVFPLEPKAIHIDYLRLRCGYEAQFFKRHQANKIKGAYAFIAFSEWDVVLFIPGDRLYANNLLAIYENPEITQAIAGSAGYYNYIWQHPINSDWEQRLTRITELKTRNTSHVAMLLSLRFTDRFRATYGIGAEMLFCNFLERLKNNLEGKIDLFAVHSVGWNDATVMIWSRKGDEPALLDALTAIRYCTVAKCVGNDNPAHIVAASYSHVLGNLSKYVKRQLDFGAMGERVRQARLLVRTTPAMERAIRDAYDKTAALVRTQFNVAAPAATKRAAEVSTELGHYNFSADIGWTFRKGVDGRAPVKVIQGLRREIGNQLRTIKRESSSFPETTTEIRFFETEIEQTKEPPRNPIRTLTTYTKLVERLMRRLPRTLEGHMTRHRVAILLASISTYLADPVRGSVVGHICKFLATSFETALQRMDPDQQEDLCHVMEYALNQATDGLSQFQHDANSLGLSGRGGYVRVIQAMDQWMSDLLNTLNLDLMPLITYGLHPSHSSSAARHRVDVPFSTAFAPAQWAVLFHEVGHICWHDLFGWRLESLETWLAYTRMREPFQYRRGKGTHVAQMDARSDVAEVFPNYLMLNLAAHGDVQLLDRMMLYREWTTIPRRAIAPVLRRRFVIHVLLALHKAGRPKFPLSVLKTVMKTDEIRSSDVNLLRQLSQVADDWWNTWREIREDKRLGTRVTDIVEKAIAAFSQTMSMRMANRDARRDGTYGKTTELIPTSLAFKTQIAKAVHMCLDLLVVLASDHESRTRKAKPGVFPEATFGEVLARIEITRLESERAYHDWKPLFGEAVKTGVVISNIAAAPVLARLLADLEDNATDRHMIPSLSVILSLWHRGVTNLLLEESDKLPKVLEDLDLTCRLP
jgi:hypothetical protein